MVYMYKKSVCVLIMRDYIMMLLCTCVPTDLLPHTRTHAHSLCVWMSIKLTHILKAG